MSLVSGIDDEVVISTIYKVADKIAPRFTFGYHEVEDLRQQAVILSLEKYLPKYDGRSPLENYLSTCIRNGLYNFKRDNYVRHTPPCKKCPASPEDSSIDSTPLSKLKFCSEKCRDRYITWKQQNFVRQNLMDPLNIQGVRDEDEKNMRRSSDIIEKLSLREFSEFINKNLDVETRKDFLRLLDEALPPSRKESLLEKIKEIIQEVGFE